MKRYNADYKKRHLSFAIIAGLLVTGLLVGGFLYLGQRNKKQPQATTTANIATPTLSPTPSKQPTTLTGRYLLNGTIFWGRGIEHWSKGDITWPFAKLSTFNRDVYDGWVADLECPITNNLISFEKQVSDLIFNCDPKFLPEMAKYFNLIDLANNHSDNQGYEGLVETRKRLQDAGLQTFGSYDPSTEEDTCEVIALPIKQDGQQASLPVAFCAWHYFYRTPKEGEIERMKKYAKLMPVFAFVHMGSEYQAKASDIQVSIAHQVADAGASFVIANNPHWVQNSEAYNGKLIVYSTGNFIFDQLDYETQRSASIDVTMKASGDNLQEWLEVGKGCKDFHDSCIQQITEKALTPYKATFSFGVVAGDNSGNHQTRKGDSVLQKAIEDRLDWQHTLAGLKQ